MSFMHPRTLRSAVLARMTFSGTNGSVTGFMCARCSGGLGGRVRTWSAAAVTQCSSAGPCSPAGCTKIMFFIGLPVKSISPDVVNFKCLLGGLVAEPDHELAAHDAYEHVPAQEEGKAAEHLSFGHLGVGRYRLPDAVSEVLVVGHQASRWPGRPKKRNRAGSAKQ